MKIPKPIKLPSGSWRCQLRLNGRSVSVTESTYDKCYALAVAIKAGLIDARKNPPAMTLGQAIDEYIDSRSNILSPSTISGYRQARRIYFQELMPVKLNVLTRQILQREVNRAAGAGLSPKTIKNAFMLIKSATKGLLSFDASEVKLPAPEPREGTALTSDQLAALLRAVEGTDVEVPVLLAAWLSLRRSEIVGLRWCDIGEDSITVCSAMVFDDRHELVRKTTKTAKSTRTIPCPAYILEKIKALPHTDPERIFTLHPNIYYDRLRSACHRAGIPQIGLHALRHTNASIMLLVGVGEKYAMERGGWSTNRVMQAVYQHTLDEGRADAARRVDSYFDRILSIAHENAHGK